AHASGNWRPRMQNVPQTGSGPSFDPRVELPARPADESSREPPSSSGATSGPVSATFCPGCGQSVDPLRAGHVAVLESSGFHYFCDALCKRHYLSARGQPQEEDVATASPPDVEYASASPSEAPRSDLRARATPSPASNGHSPTLPSIATTSPTEQRGTRATLPSIDVHEAFELSRPISVRPADPSARRAPAPSTSRGAADRGADRTTAFIDGMGIVAGVFAPAIGLLGAVADVARVPLVVFAWAALALRVHRVGRDPSDPHAYVVLAPAGGAPRSRERPDGARADRATPRLARPSHPRRRHHRPSRRRRAAGRAGRRRGRRARRGRRDRERRRGARHPLARREGRSGQARGRPRGGGGPRALEPPSHDHHVVGPRAGV